MKTVTVTPREYDQTVTHWASRGLVVTAQTPTSTTLARPRKPPRTFWSAVKLTILTLGVYPLVWLTWVGLLAWWVKPIIAASRVDKITIRVNQTATAPDYY